MSITEDTLKETSESLSETTSKYSKYEIVSIIILIFGITLLVWTLGYLLGKRVMTHTNDEYYKAEGIIDLKNKEEKNAFKQLTFQDVLKIKKELDQLKSIYAHDISLQSIKKQSGENSVSSQPITPSRSKSQFIVQVSAFKKEAQANALVAYLKHKGFNAFKEVKRHNGQIMWYRVRVGIYTSREEAARAALHLNNKENLTTFITTLVE